MVPEQLQSFQRFNYSYFWIHYSYFFVTTFSPCLCTLSCAGPRHLHKCTPEQKRGNRRTGQTNNSPFCIRQLALHQVNVGPKSSGSDFLSRPLKSNVGIDSLRAWGKRRYGESVSDWGPLHRVPRSQQETWPRATLQILGVGGGIYQSHFMIQRPALPLQPANTNSNTTTGKRRPAQEAMHTS